MRQRHQPIIGTRSEQVERATELVQSTDQAAHLGMLWLAALVTTWLSQRAMARDQGLTDG